MGPGVGSLVVRGDNESSVCASTRMRLVPRRDGCGVLGVVLVFRQNFVGCVDIKIF